MQDHSSSDWPAMAAANGLDSFESIWALDIGWFEPPNVRRGGWSGVSRLELISTDGHHEALFIKRQENHETFSWRHPFKGISTFRREFRNLERLHSVGVATLDLLYFAERNIAADRRAILITRELTGYKPLDVCLAEWRQQGLPSGIVWRETLQRIAAVARVMHRQRIQHNCFHPKHIFLGELHGQVDVRLIDLEKAKRCWSTEQAMLRDLDALNRRVKAVRNTDRLRFLLAYHEVERVNHTVRKTWNRLLALYRKKRRSRLLHK